jgi:RNA polymerase sigma-70 factor (ECF subfamily)
MAENVRMIIESNQANEGAATTTASSIPDEINLAFISVANYGDQKAMRVLFDFFAQRLYGFAIKKVGDDATAKEVLQDTMTTVWRKASTFDKDKGNLASWIYTIARNLCFDIGRKRKVRSLELTSDMIFGDCGHTEEAAESTTLNQETVEQLRGLIQQLPQQQQQVINLVYMKDMSHQAAADHLGLPVGTVKSRIRLALEKLSALTNEEEFGYE